MYMQKHTIASVLKEGEGQKIEFKEHLSGLAPEMVAFTNANGGSVYIGITDEEEVKPIILTNRLRSQITDIARNCDPPIAVSIVESSEGVIIVSVPEGKDKPYKCKEGFYMRIGPNSQKLNRNEIINLVHHAGKVRFDEIVSEAFKFPNDFDNQAWEEYKKRAGYPPHLKVEEALINIGVLSIQEKRVLATNGALLFFAKNPQSFFPEAKISCIKYRGASRYDIADRREFKGTILEQLEGAMAFFERYNAKEIKITGSPQHEEWEDYPTIAIREALINALIHRDYFYDSSHIYVHLYDNHLEIDNPGGLIQGMTMEDLGKKAARRNRMLADLAQRAGYIENVGTGIARIREALVKNNNPPVEISATNFFSLKFIPRPRNLTSQTLTERQKVLYTYIAGHGPVSKTQCQRILEVGSDTALTELTILLSQGLIKKSGKGKNTRYYL